MVVVAGAGFCVVVDEVVVLSSAKAAPATATLQAATAANIVDNFMCLHSLWVLRYPTQQSSFCSLAAYAMRYISRPLWRK